ncbi:hypothetical protein [Bacillus cereus]|uniref:hypothetical protein n=1 Tax=Bacillus cereus TaxID=1396 RepID=UPI000B4C18C1|nr:hypothetical protein [Bacillus cereus]
MSVLFLSPVNNTLFLGDELGIVFNQKLKKVIGRFEKNGSNTYEFYYENDNCEKIIFNEKSMNAAFVRLLQRFCLLSSYTYKDLSIDQGYRFRYKSWKELAEFLMVNNKVFIESELEFLITEVLSRNYETLRPIFERFILKVCSNTKYKTLAEGLCRIEDKDAFNRSFQNLIGTMWN